MKPSTRNRQLLLFLTSRSNRQIVHTVGQQRFPECANAQRTDVTKGNKEWALLDQDKEDTSQTHCIFLCRLRKYKRGHSVNQYSFLW